MKEYQYIMRVSHNIQGLNDRLDSYASVFMAQMNYETRIDCYIAI